MVDIVEQQGAAARRFQGSGLTRSNGAGGRQAPEQLNFQRGFVQILAADRDKSMVSMRTRGVNRPR